MRFISLRKLLSRRSAFGAADGIRPGPAMPPAAGLDREMPVEVMLDFDTVLLFGKLAETGPAGLRIERVLDDMCFPILKKGGIVLVRGYDAQMNPILLRAVVVQSSGVGCEVERLERVRHETDRKLVRCPVYPSGTVLASEDTAPERPWPCQLLNISPGGACIVSERRCMPGQSLCIRIRAAEGGGALCCRVVRATPRRGGFFEYGLRFVRLSREQRRCLSREIQAIKAETGEKLRDKPCAPERM